MKSLEFANLITIALRHCLAQPDTKDATYATVSPNKNDNKRNPEDLREKIAGKFKIVYR